MTKFKDDEVDKTKEDVNSHMTESPKNFQELEAVVKSIAYDRLAAGGNISGPTFYFLDEEGQMSIVLGPNVPPAMMRPIMVGLFKERKAIAFAMMSETWHATVDEPSDLVEPRLSPKKRDAYMVLSATRLGEKHMYVGFCEKDGEKTLSVEPLEEQPTERALVYEGFLSIFDEIERPSIN